MSKQIKTNDGTDNGTDSRFDGRRYRSIEDLCDAFPGVQIMDLSDQAAVMAAVVAGLRIQTLPALGQAVAAPMALDTAVLARAVKLLEDPATGSGGGRPRTSDPARDDAYRAMGLFLSDPEALAQALDPARLVDASDGSIIVRGPAPARGRRGDLIERPAPLDDVMARWDSPRVVADAVVVGGGETQAVRTAQGQIYVIGTAVRGGETEIRAVALSGDDLRALAASVDALSTPKDKGKGKKGTK